MKWEYKKVDGFQDFDFDGLGDKGWELITVVRNPNYDYMMLFYFKRPLNEKDV